MIWLRIFCTAGRTKRNATVCIFFLQQPSEVCHFDFLVPKTMRAFTALWDSVKTMNRTMFFKAIKVLKVSKICTCNDAKHGPDMPHKVPDWPGKMSSQQSPYVTPTRPHPNTYACLEIEILFSTI